MDAFLVYRQGRLINTVYFISSMTADEVRESLINHDGYPSDIAVTRRKAWP